MMMQHTGAAVRAAVAVLAVALGATAAATEVDFWRAYRGADEATYLLASFDNDSVPTGTAAIREVDRVGSVQFADGKFGRAMRLDGRSALRCKTNAIFSGGYVALESWIKLDAYPEKLSRIVFRKAKVDANAAYDPAADVTKGFSLSVDHQGALLLDTTNCFYGNTTRTSSPPGAVSVGRWVHVAGTSMQFPVSYRRLFVDGHEVAAEAITWGKGLVVSGDEERQPGDVWIGNDATGEAGLRGLIDQVRIHLAVAKFWPEEDASWTQANRPGTVSAGPPHFLPANRPRLHLPLDGNTTPAGDAPQGLAVSGAGRFAPGVCGQAHVGKLDLRAVGLLDLKEGSLEFWLKPVGVNSYSDRNYGFVGGPFIFYLYNSGTIENKPLTAYFRKPDGDLQFVSAGDFETRPGRWYHFAITWRGREVAVYTDGKLGQQTFDAGLPGPSDQLTFPAAESLIDEVYLYPKALTAEEVANAYHRYRDRSKLFVAQSHAVDIRAQYLPSQRTIFYRLLANVPPEQVERVELRLTDESDKELLRHSTVMAAEERPLTVPDLADGNYTLSADAILRDGTRQAGGTFRFRRHRFAWENNRLGITDEVFPPFEPVRVEGNRIRIVGREYAMNGVGMFDQVTSLGRDLLAAPIALRFQTAAGEGTWASAAGKCASSRPSGAVWEAEALAAPIIVRTRSTIEIDGCTKVAMTLLPGSQPGEIRKMWVEVPLKDSESPLMHTCTAGLRQNHAGAAPPGEGVVWDGAKAHHYNRWLNAFVPYIWLGSERRGLAWFGENDRGWLTAKSPEVPVQELVREGGRLTLRVYLINQPTTLRGPSELVFGLQASPTKPMPPNWRRRLPHVPGGLAVVPWGGLECASQAPFRDDWRIVDKIVECREGKPFDAAWFEDYAARHKPPPAHGNWPWIDHVRHFAGRAAEVGPKHPIAVYQEEMRGCPARPEWAIFQDEWTVEPFRYQRSDLPDRIFRDGYESLSSPQNITFPPSYQDFGCSIAHEWLRRGVSLYWDNTYPYLSRNPRTSAAYFASDGRMQPAMIIWNHREYTKRVWHLVQLARRQRTEPLEFVLHMTNTLLLPIHTWGTVDLDHELGAEKPFSPEWLRVETTGLQVGNLPLSLYAVAGSENDIVRSLPAEQRQRIEWGLRAVHEIQRDGPQEKLLTDFGYADAVSAADAAPSAARPAVVVHNYWDDRPVLRVEPPTVKWLALEKPATGELVIVLAAWSEEAVTARIAVNAAAFKLAQARLTDAETGAALSESSNGIFPIDLPGPWGTRVLRLAAPGR